MAAGSLHKPGSDYGPCIGDCHHTDCAESRKMAQSRCELCGKWIGYERRFYHQPSGNYAHAKCVEEKHYV